jgi:AraC family ethanolamine operon transcriptional activator
MRAAHPVRLGVSGKVEQADLSTEASADVHHQATLLRAWDQKYTQLRPGGFTGSVSTLRNGGVKLFREEMNRAVFQMGALPTTKLAFGLPVRAAGRTYICGEEGTGDSLLVFSGSSGFEFLSPEDFEFYGVEIETAASDDPVFLTMVRTLAQVIASSNRAIRLDGHRLRKLGRLLGATLCEEGIGERLQTWPDHAAAFNRGLVGWMLDMLQAAPAEAESPPMRHWDTIAAIRQLVAQNSCCPSSVAELTVELGVSRRTLQNACQEIVGMSPVQYLRALRLSEVRRMMEQSRSVTEVATQFGFWHLSYFARDYHAMFGELPSKTLERVRTCQA